MLCNAAKSAADKPRPSTPTGGEAVVAGVVYIGGENEVGGCVAGEKVCGVDSGLGGDFDTDNGFATDGARGALSKFF